MKYIFITGTHDMNVIMIATIIRGEWNGVWRLGPSLQDNHSGGGRTAPMKPPGV